MKKFVVVEVALVPVLNSFLCVNTTNGNHFMRHGRNTPTSSSPTELGNGVETENNTRILTHIHTHIFRLQYHGCVFCGIHVVNVLRWHCLSMCVCVCVCVCVCCLLFVCCLFASSVVVFV